MNTDILNMLKANGVEFDEGLSDLEIIKIKEEYDVEFPSELKMFYSIALPISKYFYNWRDFSPENVAKIKRALKRPFEDVYEMADELYWCEDWGIEPDENERIETIRLKLENAPKLIPIYSHRYMPMIDKENIPIISICDTDLIYYGENLSSYLEIEFGDKRQDDINFNKIERVPFWSDLI